MGNLRYMGISLISNTPSVGPYCSPVPRDLMVILGGGGVLMSEVPL